MSPVCNRPGWRRLGRAGVTSLEFALVAALFFTVLIGCMDLGRYFLIAQSLRTVTAEAARLALVNGMWGQIDPTAYSFGAMTPLVDNANLTLTVTPKALALGGVRKLTVTATYVFTAYSPIWTVLNGTISESTVLWE